MADNEDKKGKEETKSVSELELELALMQEQVETQKTLNEQVEGYKELKEVELQLYKQQTKEAKETINYLNLKKIAGQKLTEQEKDRLNLAIKDNKEAKKNLEILQEQLNIQEQIVSTVNRNINLLTGARKENDTILGKVNNMLKSTGGLAANWTLIKKEVSEYLNTSTLSEAILSKIVQSTMLVAAAQDIASTSVNKALGATGQYNDLIGKTTMSNLAFNASMSDSAEVVTSLASTMNSFTFETEANKAAIANTTLQLSKLGISADTTARNMQIATRSLGMTSEQGRLLQKDLFDTATALQLPPNAVAEAFASSAPQLAAHGSKMVKVFEGLAQQSKETGVEINKLLGIVGKFDTFEGAADAAGKLNAILGGDLVNSVDLLLASEEERVKLLQDGIKLSGKQWHEMNKFEKMAIANAAGITDMAEAAAIFNPMMLGMTAAEKKNAEAKKELADRAKHVTSMMEQLNAITASFAVIITPVLSVVKDMLDTFLKWNNTVKFGNVGIVTLVAGIAGLVAGGIYLTKMFLGLKKTLTDTTSALSGVFGKTASNTVAESVEKMGEGAGKATKSIGTGLGEALKKTASGINAVGKAATKNATGLLTLGAVAVMLGASVAIAALGVSQLVLAFNGMSPAQILSVTVAIGVFMIGMFALIALLVAIAPAAVAAGGALLPLGAAILLLGAGVAVAAYGMSLLVKSFSSLDPEQITAAGIALSKLTISIMQMMALAIFGPIIAGVLIGIGVGFMMISYSVGNVAQKIATFNESLAALDFEYIVNGYARIAQEINNIVDAIDRMPLVKATALSYLVESPMIAAAVPTMSENTPIDRLVTAAERNVNVSAAASGRTEATNQATVQPNVIVRPQIKLYIDSKEVGKALDEEIKMRIKSREKVIGGKAIATALGD